MNKKRSVVNAGVVLGLVLSWFQMKKSMKKRIVSETERVQKFKSYYNLLNQWVIVKQKDKYFETFFLHNNYKAIAIYGAGNMGQRLYDELKNTSVEVKYFIDREGGNQTLDIPVVCLDGVLESVDAVVITPVFAFHEIEYHMNIYNDFPIVSLQDILDFLENS